MGDEKGKVIDRFPAGVVNIPPSKSLSHRALICAGLAALQGEGDSLLENLGDSEDVQATMDCLTRMGVAFQREGDALRVSEGNVAPGDLPLDCGESGSTLRFLLPLAALEGKPRSFTGRGRLLDRPLEVYEGLFAEKGLGFRRRADSIEVSGPLPSGDYTLPGDVSSQFISGLLLALPVLRGDSRITLSAPLESAAYVDLTLEAMAAFGVAARREADGSFSVPGGQHYRPRRYRVEGDWSQAAFFLAAGALGCPVGCGGLQDDSRQGDRAITGILRDMGAQLRWEGGVLWASAESLAATDIDAREIPDLVPVLASLCACARGGSVIHGAGRLRLKESDRLAAMAGELNKLGAAVEEGRGSLGVQGRQRLSGGEVDAHNDHRIAMALAVAAIRCDGPVTLTGWRAVNKSYPAFWEDFQKEGRHG